MASLNDTDPRHLPAMSCSFGSAASTPQPPVDSCPQTTRHGPLQPRRRPAGRQIKVRRASRSRIYNVYRLYRNYSSDAFRLSESSPNARGVSRDDSRPTGTRPSAWAPNSTQSSEAAPPEGGRVGKHEQAAQEHCETDHDNAPLSDGPRSIARVQSARSFLIVRASQRSAARSAEPRAFPPYFGALPTSASTASSTCPNSPLRKCRFQFAVGARRMVTTSAAGSASMSAIRPKTSSKSVCKTKMKAARASAASLGVP